MNRIALTTRKLRFDLGARETIEMIDLQSNLIAMQCDQKIFNRLKVALVEHDDLSEDEIEDIQLILYMWPKVSAFECWIVDQYLIRAHLLELERWPKCSFNELPPPWPERLKQLGPQVYSILRETAA